jgi:hypothetical protein
MTLDLFLNMFNTCSRVIVGVDPAPVFQEVAEFNARTPEVFQGLVRPETQTALALRAFAGNGFLVLVGDRQVTDPDEEIELTPGGSRPPHPGGPSRGRATSPTRVTACRR